MPELPEVENVRLSLDSKVVGRTIKVVDVYHTSVIKFNSPLDFISRLEGWQITSLTRRGKFLLFHLHSQSSEPQLLIVHLGMTGALLHRTDRDYSAYPPSISQHIHIEIFLDDDTMLLYSDYRRFGSLRVILQSNLTNSNISHLHTLQQLGPEPFDPHIAELFLANIRHKRYCNKPIKDVLLDQRVLAGAGNIYASECLFPAAINPHTHVDMLSDDTLRLILRHLIDILSLSITLGGSSIKDYVNGQGTSGSFQEHLKVYDQSSCRVCHTAIAKTFIANRSTFHCPHCQPVN